MNNCIFCKIAKGEIPSQKVFENDDFLAFLDIKPINLGHTLLIPKAHYENIFDLPCEITSNMADLFQKIAKAIKDATGAGGVNISMNNGEVAGQIVPHAHIHIIPRFKEDGFKHWRSKVTTTENELAETAEKIKALL
ncbi:MAG: HIT family protein [Patescibacteria group bacterium]